MLSGDAQEIPPSAVGNNALGCEESLTVIGPAMIQGYLCDQCSSALNRILHGAERGDNSRAKMLSRVSR